MANFFSNVTIYLGLSLFVAVCVLISAFIYQARIVRSTGGDEKQERFIFFDNILSNSSWDLWPEYRDPDHAVCGLNGQKARCVCFRNRQAVAQLAIITAVLQCAFSAAMFFIPIKWRIFGGFYAYSGLLIVLSAFYLVAVIINTGPYVFVQYEKVWLENYTRHLENPYSWVVLWNDERNSFFLMLDTFLVLAFICCWNVASALSMLTFSFKNNVGYLPAGHIEERRVVMMAPIVTKKPPKKIIYV